MEEVDGKGVLSKPEEVFVRQDILDGGGEVDS